MELKDPGQELQKDQNYRLKKGVGKKKKRDVGPSLCALNWSLERAGRQLRSLYPSHPSFILSTPLMHLGRTHSLEEHTVGGTHSLEDGQASEPALPLGPQATLSPSLGMMRSKDTCYSNLKWMPTQLRCQVGKTLPGGGEAGPPPIPRSRNPRPTPWTLLKHTGFPDSSSKPVGIAATSFHWGQVTEVPCCSSREVREVWQIADLELSLLCAAPRLQHHCSRGEQGSPSPGGTSGSR